MTELEQADLTQAIGHTEPNTGWEFLGVDRYSQSLRSPADSLNSLLRMR